jgi:hypothetical protein
MDFLNYVVDKNSTLNKRYEIKYGVIGNNLNNAFGTLRNFLYLLGAWMKFFIVINIYLVTCMKI